MIVEMEKGAIVELLDNDVAIIKLANSYRTQLSSSPSQSEFRVLAILIVERVNGTLCIVVGSNAEQGYIGGAICAERAALCSLRFIESPIIRRIAVVTDSDTPISPGNLCREYLSSSTEPSTLVIIGNKDGSKISRCPLGTIQPFPYLYRFKRRAEVLGAGMAFRDAVDKSEYRALNAALIARCDGAALMFDRAAACNALDAADKVHPLRLSAACLFSDGSCESAWMLKGLEFGCTLDPVLQLIRDMKRVSALSLNAYCSPCATTASATTTTTTTTTESDSMSSETDDAGNSDSSSLGITPVMLVMLDQFGVAHAPFASARALLVEHGYKDLRIFVHSQDGQLCVTTAAELSPPPDGCAALLTHDDLFREAGE